MESFRNLCKIFYNPVGSVAGGTRVVLAGTGLDFNSHLSVAEAVAVSDLGASSALGAFINVSLGGNPCVWLPLHSSQPQIVCVTSALSDAYAGPLFPSVRVQTGEGGVINEVTCTKLNCAFSYALSRTPSLDSVSPGVITAKETLNIHGRFL